LPFEKKLPLTGELFCLCGIFEMITFSHNLAVGMNRFILVFGLLIALSFSGRAQFDVWLASLEKPTLSNKREGDLRRQFIASLPQVKSGFGFVFCQKSASLCYVGSGYIVCRLCADALRIADAY
jgi:hypothetical protein